MSETVFNGQGDYGDEEVSAVGIDAINSSVDSAANPAAMTDLGLVMEDITVQPTTDFSTEVGNFLSGFWDAIVDLFGIPAAQGGVHVVTMGTMPVGILHSTMNLSGLSFGQALSMMGAQALPSGLVVNVLGLGVGYVNPSALSVGEHALDVNTITVDDDGAALGPPDLDTVVSTATVTLNDGESIQMGVIAPTIWGQVTQLNGSVVKRTLPAPFDSSGANNSVGVAVMDLPNIIAMVSKEISYGMPTTIGGLDGLYSLTTTERLVPPANIGAAPLGFHVGEAATFKSTYLLWGGTAQGRYFMLGAGDEPIQVIDPSTGKPPVIVFWTWVVVFDGSQRISFIPSLEPAYAYNGPAPTLANPQYNTADTVSPVIALTNLLSQISTIISPATFASLNPGYNYGGSEGGQGGG